MALTLNCWENANSNGNAVNSLAVNKPTSGSALGDSPKNAEVGDLLIIVCGNDDNTNTAQWDNNTYKPAGFTLINEAGGAASDSHCAAFYKEVDGSEGSSFTIPSQATQEMWASCILIGGSLGVPFLHLVGADIADETPAPLDITGVTNTLAPTINFYLASYDGGDAGAFAVSGTGWVERQELFSGTGSGDACGVWGTRALSGTGASGTVSVTPTVSDGMYGFQFSIAEGAVSASPSATKSPSHSISKSKSKSISKSRSKSKSASISSSKSPSISKSSSVSPSSSISLSRSLSISASQSPSLSPSPSPSPSPTTSWDNPDIVLGASTYIGDSGEYYSSTYSSRSKNNR